MKYEFTCRNCGNQFKTNNKRQNKFCCEECKNNYKPHKETFNCEYCGKEMVKNARNYKKNSKHHFCSSECSYKFRKEVENIKDNCKYCGKEIYRTHSKVKEGKGLFCSRECSSKYKSENYRGENHKCYNKVVVKCDYCGKDKLIVPSDLKKYKTHFCSTECMGAYRRSPNKSDDEIYEKRKTQEHKDWTNNVYKKDNYTCVITGQVGYRLNAHHLNGYHWDVDNRFNIDNGVTLSEEIHKEFHSIYGVKNNTIEQFIEFYNMKTGKDFIIKDVSLLNQ